MKKNKRSRTPERKRQKKSCSISMSDTVIFLVMSYYIIKFLQSYKV
jgi:hypothetical protein